MARKDIAAERGMPSNPDAEKFILGAILKDSKRFTEVHGSIEADHFSLESHRRLFIRMVEVYSRGEKINHVTLADELMRYDELASVGGLSYIVSLDDGMPDLSNLDSFIRTVRDKATWRKIAISARNLMDMALGEREDPDSLIASGGESILRLGEERLQRDFETPTEIIKGVEGGINTFLSKKQPGVMTGFRKYDSMTGGMHEGELIILGARPSMGKTSFMLNIATYVALKLHLAIAIFSFEMTQESLLNRMVCARARVDSHSFRFGELTEDERRRLRIAAQELADAEIYIDDDTGTTIASAKAKLLRLKRTLEKSGKKLGLVAVDYLQLMKQPGRQDNRVQEVTAISRGFKLMAKDIRTPFIVLSQLSRAVEQRKGDGRPQLSDLRESGAIEQDADIVGFIFREELLRRDREDLRGKAELIIAKQREGPTGVVPLVFRGGLTRFENPTEEAEYE